MYTNLMTTGLVMSVIALLSGCGGSQGVSQPTTISMQNRQLQVGDTFNYSAQIDVTPPPAIPASGSRVEYIKTGIQPARHGGRPLTLDRVTTQVIDGESHTYETLIYLEQTADGAIYYSGTRSRQDWGEWTEQTLESSDKPAVFVAGNMQIGDVYAFTAYWNTGANSRITKTVESIGNTDDGQHYVISNCTYSGTSRVCYSPSIGWFCKQVDIEKRPYANVLCTYTLASKTLW